MMRFGHRARTLIGTSLVAIAAAGTAHAAALEQTVPTAIRLLYQEGRYVEFNLVYSDPDQSGSGAVLPPGVAGPGPVSIPGNTGDMFDDRWSISGAYKGDINDKLSFALIFDEPYRVATSYGQGSFPDAFNYGGTKADLKTYQVTAALAYDVRPDVKIFGGVRAQRLGASADIPFVSNYSIDTDDDWGFGWLVGAAYERPELGLRVSLTYASEIKHSLDATEQLTLTDVFPTPVNVVEKDDIDVDTPQSVTLDFQTGINPKTLVFGSIRWVDWSQFRIAPPLYGTAIAALTGEPRPLVDYQDDWWTYTLGVGRQLTDQLAGAVSIAWEPSVGGTMTTLGPYDGRTTGTASLTYEMGQLDLTGGVTYGVLGDTTNLLDTNFDDGSVWGLGLRVGYSF